MFLAFSVEIISQVQIHDVPNIELGGQGGGAHMLVSGAAFRWAMSSLGLSIFTCEIISVHCLKNIFFLFVVAAVCDDGLKCELAATIRFVQAFL